MLQRTWLLRVLLIGIFLLSGVVSAQAGSDNHRTPDGKLKVLYHIDGSDVGTAKYAMALINKHIEAEGGLDKIDVKVVVHGPALMLFDKETVDPVLKDKLKKILDIGVKPEMCQVSMKLFDRPLDKLTPGFQPTGHPVAVKRIADLQEQGYLYIKP
ncbi:MAG: DsrE family protein [Nitrospinota bacterium]|nr:DsrE family protein [Nitrospinota bacterium]